MQDYVPWWERELELAEAKTSDLRSKSATAQWRKGLGIYGRVEEDTVGASKTYSRLAELSRRLARSANVVRNSADDSERILSVGWSDGRNVNTPKDNVVYVSPDLVLKTKDHEDLVMDALTGQVLMGSTMKRTIHPNAWQQAKAAMSGPTVTVWQALETAVARREILKEWEGFSAYLRRHALQTSVSKGELQGLIDGHKPCIELAAAALAWNIQYPHDKVQVKGALKRAVEAGVKTLDCKHEATKRFELASRAISMMTRILEEELPPPPQQSENQNDETENDPETNPDNGQEDNNPDPKPDPAEDKTDPGEHQDNSGEDESSDGEPQQGDAEGNHDSEHGGGPQEAEFDQGSGHPSGGPSHGPQNPGGDEGGGQGGSLPDFPSNLNPSLTDPSLFGEPVKNSSAATSDIPTPVEIGNSDEVLELKPFRTRAYRFTRVTSYHYSHPGDYNRIAAHIRPAAMAIAGALRFRNNDVSMWNRGTLSGELDEGSLHKLILNEDHPAIWERKELIGQPKVMVGLLIDCSGSMAGVKMISATKLAIAMAEAIRKIRGCALNVLGFEGVYYLETCERYAAAQCKEGVTVRSRVVEGLTPKELRDTNTLSGCGILEVFTKEHKNPWALSALGPGGGTPTPEATEYAVRKIIADYPDYQRRILFVISDGRPCLNACGDTTYKASAIARVREVCEFARRKNVGVYGIGVCKAYTPKLGDEMFGPGNNVLINEVMDSVPILASFLRQVAMRPV
jgi:hypothetical protein